MTRPALRSYCETKLMGKKIKTVRAETGSVRTDSPLAGRETTRLPRHARALRLPATPLVVRVFTL